MFVDLFDSMLTSTFSNPWVFLKGATTIADEKEDLDEYVLPAFADTEERIPQEMSARSKTEGILNKWLNAIPTEANRIDEAVDGVQLLVLRTYSFIRSQVCDQVELFSESFFKLPMMRRLEEDMVTIDLSEDDKANYEARRGRLEGDIKTAQTNKEEIDYCINKINNFRIKVEAKKGGGVF